MGTVKMEPFVNMQTTLHKQMLKTKSNYEKKVKEAGITKHFVSTCLYIVNETWKQFQENHMFILKNACDETNSYIDGSIHEETESLYIDFTAICKEALESFTVATPLANSSTILPSNQQSLLETTIQRPEIQLPKISIPKFDGNYHNWRPFHDLFASIIHKDLHLSRVQKLHYLKTCVTGDAERLLRQFDTTEENYEKAWEMLKNRYNNKRMLVQTYIKRLLNQSIIKNETSSAIRNLLDETEEILHELKSLQVKTVDWDPILIQIITQKLPNDTLCLWERELGGSTDLPKFIQLTEFLTARFRTLESIQANAKYFSSNVNSNTQKNLLTKAPECPKCKNNHILAKCEKFKSLNVSQRKDFVQQKKLCRNCLSSEHSQNECKNKNSCFKCHQRHHTLIHCDQTTKPQDASANKYTNYLARNQKRSPCNGVQNLNHSNHLHTNAVQVNHTPLQTNSVQFTQAPVHTNFVENSHVTSHSDITQAPATIQHNGHTMYKNPTLNTQQHNNNVQNWQNSQTIQHIQDTKHIDTSQLNSVSTFLNSNTTKVLLATALVKANGPHGHSTILRALLDPGSQVSFITKNAAKKLKLKREKTDIIVTGLERSNTAHVYHKTSLQIHSLCSNFTKSLNALIINQITDNTPSHFIDTSHIPYLSSIKLADPNFAEPGPVDILLGADTYSSIMEMGTIKGNDNSPSAQATQLGWILLGPVAARDSHDNQAISLHTSVHIYDNLESRLKKFWETEEVPYKSNFSKDDELCEKIYKTTTRRLQDGSYEVALPFKNNQPPRLGASKHIAIKQFFQLEKKFQKNQEFFQMYNQCIQEYLQLGHMIEAKNISDNSDHMDLYYLPHHAVFKESTTTKLRVVFNASSKTSNGKSLNEQLLTGPTIQPTLWATLLNWRQFKHAFTADIEKMYRMIHIKEDQQEYQRIVWRSNPNERLQDYKLTTVTFGTTPAPFLAIRTLFQLAEDEKINFPLAAKCLTTNTYVDDLLCGADSLNSALELQTQLVQMLRKGGFNLRKWSSNNIELLKNIPPEHREIKSELFISDSESIKTLGIKWYPSSDEFTFSVNQKFFQNTYTKRIILSEVASLFDPLGWLSPIVITAKILIQKLWLLGLDWDHPVPEIIKNEWVQFKNELNIIEQIRIPRWTHYSNTATIELHGFSDASISAYAAVIYVKVTINNSQSYVTLLTSKTRVAPTKPVTLPRLELCGNLLLAKLLHQTQHDLKLKSAKIYAWTDSQVALGWVKGQPSKWKTYVANRVAEIQDNVVPSQWFFVPGNQNPADCASRGLFPQEFSNNNIWWQGPNWLSQSKERWPKQPINTSTDLEIKQIKTFLTIQEPDFLLKYSSYSKLLRIIAYILRFLQRCRKNTFSTKFLSLPELQLAETKILQIVQRNIFSHEIQNLKNHKPIHHKSSILTLNPFLDENSLLRVGGRIEHAQIPYSSKHPIILPKNHHISKLIIDYIHKYTIHGGCQLTLNTLRTKYWLPNAKNTIKARIRACIQCFKQNPSPARQIMAVLPSIRTNISPTFSHSGVDFAGPFLYKASKIRSSKLLKCYICLFICMATKAIHLEVATDLSANGFIAALRRFVSRRGQCLHLYSDCGTNFIGAKNILDNELRNALKEHSDEIAMLLAQDNITWHFNPPSAPHFGGIWEAGVKSVKGHLKRIIQNTNFTLEELQTLLCQIEACVNSRPLTPLTEDPETLDCLTPGHFLTGRNLFSIPEPPIPDNKKMITKWKEIQALTQQFWKKWSNEYLHTLQQRHKWNQEEPNLNINDIVLIKDERYPPTKWPLAKIIKLHPGSDNKIRVVTVQTASTTCTRPITKVCKLPIDVQ